MTPNRETLDIAMKEHWTSSSCELSVGARFEIGPEFTYESPVGGQTALVYDLNVKDSTCPSILEQPSSWLWFDAAVVAGIKCRVAYLYLLSIRPEWRGQGIGSAYICAKAAVLPSYDIRVIYLQAGYQGPRFWSKHGFTLIDKQKFWADYEEYCEFNELEPCNEMDQVVDEYFQYLKATSLTYPMFRKLEPC